MKYLFHTYNTIYVRMYSGLCTLIYKQGFICIFEKDLTGHFGLICLYVSYKKDTCFYKKDIVLIKIQSITKIGVLLFLRQTRCDCMLWSAPWFYCVFCEFLHISSNHSCLKCSIFSKLLQIMFRYIVLQTFTDCLLHQYMHTFCYIDMPNVTASYGMTLDFVTFFGNFDI